MSRTPHIMILASAGSGKTYALTNRYVELLAAGAEPERIVALTFTRKAAGEFFDEILRKLARAASDPAYARRLADELEIPRRPGASTPGRLGPGDFLRLLRRMVDAMHRLRLGTLDSFFARIARTFPLELGLTGDFEILQEHAARLERRRVLRSMFARAGGGLDAAQTEFIEAFKRATFGAEEKQLGARLDAFLDQYQENFLSAPDRAMWGDGERIWPGGSPWLVAEIKLAEAVRDLRAALGALTDGQRARWEAFFAALEEWTPGAPLSDAIEYVLKNALAVWRDIDAGSAEITFDRRKLTLAPDACRALARIVRQIVGTELRRRLETTRGIFAVLRSYESNYHDAVRRAGRLTFGDVQRLLNPESGAPALSGSSGRRDRTAIDPGNREDSDAARDGQLSLLLPDDGDGGSTALADSSGDAEETAGERRLLLDYRLDAEIDHWLLDEFQDTSFGQWSVLRNLIDEVVQDPEGRRSFFCVGDVKQAIYSWREGDPRLFREIFNHYNAAAPGAIEERHLVASWRSGPPLIEMVNTVFGDATRLAELFPGRASTTWNREWRTHESALPRRTGQAALLHAADEQERWTVARRIIEEIRPLERGLSCAILVKKNDTAAALADFLRRAGIAAIAESDLHVATDNPLGAALLALIQAVAHPGDTLAQEQVRMTPLADALVRHGLTTPEAVTGHLLTQIHADGFESALEFWVAELQSRLASDDAFSRLRAREFVAAAGLFDATGSRDLDEFIAFMERHTVRPAESAAVVRVMTIHKSKGLGFDVVLLPDLEGNRIDERRDGLAVQKGEDRSVRWVLDLPPKLFCAQDEVLAAHVSEAEADACYESLSLLYVGLTRAKRAMYVIVEPVGQSKSRNYPKLLEATLGPRAGAGERAADDNVRVGALNLTGVWSSGDPDWHQAEAPQPRKPALESSLIPVPDDRMRVVRHLARRPSAARSGTVAAGALFSLDRSGAAKFGTDLHALLAEIDWASAGDATRWADRWSRRRAPVAVVEAGARCVAAAGLASVWSKPGPESEVWRERSFEIVLDGVWITGVFDRVVLEKANGRFIRAVIYDFKTDRVGSEAEVDAAASRYAAQLNEYRRVVAVLAHLPKTEVRCEIVLTAAARVVTVPGP